MKLSIFSYMAVCFIAMALFSSVGMASYTFDKQTKTAVIDGDLTFRLLNNTNQCDEDCYATFEISSKSGGKLPMDYLKFIGRSGANKERMAEFKHCKTSINLSKSFLSRMPLLKTIFS